MMARDFLKELKTLVRWVGITRWWLRRNLFLMRLRLRPERNTEKWLWRCATKSGRSLEFSFIQRVC